MKRITPEEVVAAYKKTGRKARRNLFIDDKGCCCGAGIIYAQHHPTMQFNASRPMAQEDAIRTWLDSIYSISYRIGFTGGFDGMDFVILQDQGLFNRDEQKQGYEDGIAAYAAVVAAGLI